MAGTLQNPECVSIDTAMHNTIGSHGLNPELEFVASVGEFSETTCVSTLGQGHSNLAAVENIASTEFRRTGERAGRYERLVAVHAVVIPLPGLLPAIRDRGFVVALYVAFIDLGS